MSSGFPELPLHPERASVELPARDRGAIAEALAASKVGVKELTAAVDVGTNTALLLVGKVEDGELTVVEELGATPRLGAGLARTGGLDDDAIKRTMEVLRHFIERMDINGVAPERRRFVGTAVFRRASDAHRIIERARDELDVALEILPEEEEARLSHVAVTLTGASQKTVVIDVGGGSTELAWDEGGERASIPVGAVVLTESWFGLDGGSPIKEGGWDGLLSEVEEAARALPEGIARGMECVLVGGAAVNLACLDQDLDSFDARLADGRQLEIAVVEAKRDLLAEMSLEARLDLPVEPGRAEILPAGLACFSAVLRRIGAERARVTTHGLRHSLVFELAAAAS
jgi:exopolyphosphatase/guanosine-5'-triphosphate,3'-diphosphate pyrophosphatase